MFIDRTSGAGTWGAESFLLGAAMMQRRDFNTLPEEVKAYLSEHEGEIRDERDVERLVQTYNLKK